MHEELGHTLKVRVLWLAATFVALLTLVAALVPTGTADAASSKVIVGINRNLSITPNAVGFVFNDPFYDLTGQPIGADSGACEALPSRGDVTGEFKCDTVFTFSNGSVSATGIQGPGAGAGPVTGGTGAYEGCTGGVVGVPNADTPEPQDFKITIRLIRCVSGALPKPLPSATPSPSVSPSTAPPSPTPPPTMSSWSRSKGEGRCYAPTMMMS